MAAFSAIGCMQSEKERAEIQAVEDRALENEPAQVVEGGYFEYTEQGRVIQALDAAVLTRKERSNTEGSSEPTHWNVSGGFTLYIGGGRTTHDATLTAIRGTYNEEVSRLEAWEDVVLVNKEGERLETEHLIWSHDSDLVRTDRPVAIFTAQGILRGRGLTSDSRFERYNILAPTGSFDLGLDHSQTEP